MNPTNKKGFRSVPTPSKGKVMEENQKLSQQLAQQLQFVAQMSTQAVQAVRQLGPEVDALTSLEASQPTDEAARPNDHVMMDYLGVLLKEDGTEETDEHGLPAYQQGMIGIKFCLRGLGRGSLIPGFEEQLVGKKAGETVDVRVKFPADYGAKEMAGRSAKFTVTIHRVYRPFAFSPVELALQEYQAKLGEIMKAKAEAKKAAEAAQTPEQAVEAPAGN